MKRRTNGVNSYTDAEKNKAVGILVQFGGLTYEGILACQEYLPGVDKSTLARWLKERKEDVKPVAKALVESDPQALQASNNMNNKLLAAYENVLNQLADENFVKGNKNLLHTATSFGILEERIRLHIGLSTEIINLVKRFIAVLGRKGFDPVTTFEDLLAEYEKEPDLPNKIIDMAYEPAPEPVLNRFGRGKRR